MARGGEGGAKRDGDTVADRQAVRRCGAAGPARAAIPAVPAALAVLALGAACAAPAPGPLGGPGAGGGAPAALPPDPRFELPVPGERCLPSRLRPMPDSPYPAASSCWASPDGSAAPVAPSETAGTGRLRPLAAYTASARRERTSGFSLRKVRAFSRPCPMRSSS